MSTFQVVEATPRHASFRLKLTPKRCHPSLWPATWHAACLILRVSLLPHCSSAHSTVSLATMIDVCSLCHKCNQSAPRPELEVACWSFHWIMCASTASTSSSTHRWLRGWHRRRALSLGCACSIVTQLLILVTLRRDCGALPLWCTCAISTQLLGCIAGWGRGAFALWCACAILTQLLGCIAGRRRGAIALWRTGTISTQLLTLVALRRDYGALSLWCTCAIITQLLGCVAGWRRGAFTLWCACAILTQLLGCVAGWGCDGALSLWCTGAIWAQLLIFSA
jgi:hypothetical protein